MHSRNHGNPEAAALVPAPISNRVRHAYQENNWQQQNTWPVALDIQHILNKLGEINKSILFALEGLNGPYGFKTTEWHFQVAGPTFCMGLASFYWLYMEICTF